MGKRKRNSGTTNNKTPPPSDIEAFSPQEVQQLEESSSGQAENSATPSIMDVGGSSFKRPSGRQSPVNQSHGSNRAMLLKHARHSISRHYSRRSSGSHIDASPSNSKWGATPVHDPKFSLKVSGKDLADLHYRDSRDRSFHKPDRIRPSSSAANPVPTNIKKIECSICQKRLQKKPFALDDSLPANDLTVVAVLVCGHAYHADCLEQKTNHEDKQDPPCPLCVS